MKYLYHLFILVSLGMTIYLWHSMVEERTQIAVALDARALESYIMHGDFARLAVISKSLIEQEERMIVHLDQATGMVKTIEDRITDLDNDTHLLQKVHQEFLDAWKSEGKVK